MGIRIWMDAKVDFTRHKNLAVAGAPLIVATGLGVKGLTVAGMDIAAIARGTGVAWFFKSAPFHRRPGIADLSVGWQRVHFFRMRNAARSSIIIN